jgi:hypothetical protein
MWAVLDSIHRAGGILKDKNGAGAAYRLLIGEAARDRTKITSANAPPNPARRQSNRLKTADKPTLLKTTRKNEGYREKY